MLQTKSANGLQAVDIWRDNQCCKRKDMSSKHICFIQVIMRTDLSLTFFYGRQERTIYTTALLIQHTELIPYHIRKSHVCSTFSPAWVSHTSGEKSLLVQMLSSWYTVV